MQDLAYLKHSVEQTHYIGGIDVCKVHTVYVFENCLKEMLQLLLISMYVYASFPHIQFGLHCMLCCWDRTLQKLCHAYVVCLCFFAERAYYDFKMCIYLLQ